MTDIIRRIAKNYWKAAHDHKRRRVREYRGFVGNAAVDEYTYCISHIVMEIHYWRMLLCSWLKLDPETAWLCLDDLDQYPDVYQFYSAIEYYLTKKENEEMNKFPELKPMMLVECKDDSDIYTYYLIAGKLGAGERLYEAYKLFVSSTGEVSLSELVSVGDLAERAVAVYASNGPDLSLAPGAIVRIAENDSAECARRIVWQREKPPLEVTMEEVCEKFGCAVKIVKEK